MTTASRLDRLYPGLTALERARLVLQGWKEDAEEDRQVRATIPDRQVSEFNRYIELMNGANHRLGPYLIVLAAFVEQIDIKYGWYCAMRVWGADVAQLGLYIFRHIGEPVTEAERQKRGKKHPDWGLDFAVLPDNEAVQVARLKDERARVRRVIKRAPTPMADLDPATKGKVTPSWGDEIAEALLDDVASRARNYWREVLAIDAVVGEIREEFEGEDPLVPSARAVLEGVRGALADLLDQLRKTGVSEALPELDAETLSRVRQLARVGDSL